MTNIGLPVPPGFIISTTTCLQYFEREELPFGLVEEVAEAIKAIEAQTGREFGNPQNPLLFSVRSGAAISMPGMMDTGKFWDWICDLGCWSGCGDLTPSTLEPNRNQSNLKSIDIYTHTHTTSTVLSLGMNDEVAAALVKKSGNPRWVYDTYRRFIQVRR